MAPPVPTPSTPSAATTPSSVAPGTTGSTAGLGVDLLYGEAGNDLLDGGAGADTMEGGAGNDAYYVEDLGDIIREAAAGAAGGTDTVYASVGFTLGANLENLTLYGAALRGEGNQLANRITGNAGANELFGRLGRDTLIGNAGDDLLDGGADIDRMEGGAGNDAYYVDNAGDLTIESLAGAAGGTDTVNASVNRTLGANLEHLRLYGSATTGTGNALANTITGNGGNNVLSGLNGNDTLIGGLGNDRLLGGAGNDIPTFVGQSSDLATGELATGGRPPPAAARIRSSSSCWRRTTSTKARREADDSPGGLLGRHPPERLRVHLTCSGPGPRLGAANVAIRPSRSRCAGPGTR